MFASNKFFSLNCSRPFRNLGSEVKASSCWNVMLARVLSLLYHGYPSPYLNCGEFKIKKRMEDHRRFLHQESTCVFGLPKRHWPKDWYFLPCYIFNSGINTIVATCCIVILTVSSRVGGLHHLSLEGTRGQTQLYQIQLKLLQEVFTGHQRTPIQQPLQVPPYSGARCAACFRCLTANLCTTGVAINGASRCQACSTFPAGVVSGRQAGPIAATE